MHFLKISTFVLTLFLMTCEKNETPTNNLFRTPDNGEWLILSKADLAHGTHHTQHAETFGQYVTGYNTFILQAIDSIQGTALDGGGYFIGIKADPPESPIGYDVNLFHKQLLKAPRKTSYCSGSSYSVFIESLNLIYKNQGNKLSEDRYESLRMQELDNGRREDGVKFWGKWNDDGYGNHFALVQYSGIGEQVTPKQARPGDFLNISWKNGGGHSVIFLGWAYNDKNEKCVVYWSSQRRTNGLGDDIVPISRIDEVMLVRVAHPDNLFTFDVNKQVSRSVKGNSIDW